VLVLRFEAPNAETCQAIRTEVEGVVKSARERFGA
jgi:hypothetical protein